MNHFRNDPTPYTKRLNQSYNTTHSKQLHTKLHPSNINKLNRDKTNKRIKTLIRIRETDIVEFISNHRSNLTYHRNPNVPQS